MVTEYSQLSHDDLVFWAIVNIVGQGTRAAQNNANMYRCLYNTATPDLLSRLLLEAHLHHIGEIPIAAMYYKQMMGFANVDTEATISLTRQQLSTLDVKMIELNSDIPAFNSYVQELLSKLHQHGTTSEDTLTNLFRGYRAAQDANFHSFILDIERKFLYGIDQVTVTQLMSRARTAYQVEKDKGTWGALSEEQQILQAVQAEVKILKDANLRLKNNKKDGEKDKSKSKKKKKQKGKGEKKAHNNRDPEPKWKLTAPKQTESKQKVVEGKKYYWCPHHNDGKGKWVLHTLSECRNNPDNSDSKSTQHTVNAATANAQQVTAAVQAAAAVAALNNSNE